jgi:pyridine nucleotide-disulfide oxidoreductase family protein
VNQQPITPPGHELVLVGGGHSHALLVRQLGEQPLPNLRVTLVSESAWASYSGMLPGHVAGFYSREEMHINLKSLCAFAGVSFVEAPVTGLDLKGRHVCCEGHNPIHADVLSLNVGATPQLSACPGAEQWAIPSKPVPRLLAGWESVQAAARTSRQALRLVIVGGGAAGVELALAMRRQLPPETEFNLIHHGAYLLPGHNPRVRTIITRLLHEREIAVRLGERVVEVAREGVRCESGASMTADFVFWITQAAPPSWLSASRLAVTPEGFVRVTPTLQSISHDWVFAAGDVATIEGAARPKSGVYAVRMSRPLAANLRAYVAGEPLRPYRPQRHCLNLIGTADRQAVASRHWLAGRTALFWRWKDWIDRRFMRQFSNLPARPTLNRVLA